jgi:pimeloyl-ACP methyl ester carboxylesterase
MITRVGLAALEEGVSHVRGCAIRWWARGTDGPPLVLVHGGSAHAGWWDPLLPHVDPRRRIVALDLSGHGDSGRRDAYPMTTWAEEVLAAIGDAAGGEAVIVGHSMGGRVAPLAAATDPGAVRALVLVDSAVPLPAGFEIPRPGPRRIYPTLERALVAFRLLPPQPSPPAGVMSPLARRSVAPLDGGWSWKFDPAIFDRLASSVEETQLARVRCPVVLVHGERSDVTEPGMADALAAALGRYVPLLTIPGAHHHVSLDAPEALAALLAWLPETTQNERGSPRLSPT